MISSELKQYILKEISEPSTYPHYNPNGNSQRAVMERYFNRGIFASIVWECGEVYSDVRYLLFKSFKGFETEVAWFIQVALLPIIVIVAPFTYGRVRDAVKAYEHEFKESK